MSLVTTQGNYLPQQIRLGNYMAIMEGKRGCQSIVKIHVYRVYQTAFFIQQNITYITVYIKLNGFEKMHFLWIRVFLSLTLIVRIKREDVWLTIINFSHKKKQSTKIKILISINGFEQFFFILRATHCFSIKAQ